VQFKLRIGEDVGSDLVVGIGAAEDNRLAVDDDLQRLQLAARLDAMGIVREVTVDE